jgi:hypothetical protein
MENRRQLLKIAGRCAAAPGATALFEPRNVWGTAAAAQLANIAFRQQKIAKLSEVST